MLFSKQSQANLILADRPVKLFDHIQYKSLHMATKLLIKPSPSKTTPIRLRKQELSSEINIDQ